MNKRHVQKMAVLIFLTATLSQCKKNLSQSASDEVLQSNSSEERSITESKKWGAVINGSAASPADAEDPSKVNYLDPVDKVSLALDYGVTYIRSGVTKETWDESKEGFLYTYDQYTDNGFKIVLNIIWKDPMNKTTGEPEPVPFVANAGDKTGAYYKFVKQVIDTLSSPHHVKPAMVVVENEETNKGYHVLDHGKSDYDKYIGMLDAVISICSPKGIPVTNGGLTARGLTFATHDWMKSFPKRVEEAKTYASNSMPPSAYYTLYPPPPSGVSTIGTDNIATQVDMVNYYIDHYKTRNMGGINVHWYEPVKVRSWDDSKNNGTPWKYKVSKNDISSGSLDGMVEYVSKKGSPLKVISNEIGQLTTSDCLTKKIMNKVDERPYNAFSIACWFDCDAGEPYGAKALHNTYNKDPLYKIRSAGSMFQEIIKRPSSSKSCTPLN